MKPVTTKGASWSLVPESSYFTTSQPPTSSLSLPGPGVRAASRAMDTHHAKLPSGEKSPRLGEAQVAPGGWQ